MTGRSYRKANHIGFVKLDDETDMSSKNGTILFGQSIHSKYIFGRGYSNVRYSRFELPVKTCKKIDVLSSISDVMENINV